MLNITPVFTTMALPNMLALTATIAALVLLPTGTSALAIPSEQRTCCTPDQWEAGLGYVTVGSSVYSSSYGRTAFDYTNQQHAMNKTFLGAGVPKQQHRILLNGKSRKIYVLDLITGRCTTSPMPSSGVKRQCVPPGFKYTQPITFGDSSGQLSGLVFQGNDYDTNYTLVISQKQCAPAFVMARQGEKQLTVHSFYNFTTGIKDRSVFNIPPGCKAAESRHSGGDAAAAVLMRQFRSLQDAPCTSMFSPCWMAK